MSALFTLQNNNKRTIYILTCCRCYLYYGANATENIPLLRTLAGPGGTGYDRCLHVSIVVRCRCRRGCCRRHARRRTWPRRPKLHARRCKRRSGESAAVPPRTAAKSLADRRSRTAAPHCQRAGTERFRPLLLRRPRVNVKPRHGSLPETIWTASSRGQSLDARFAATRCLGVPRCNHAGCAGGSTAQSMQ